MYNILTRIKYDTLKKAFKKARSIFIYLTILFTTIYWLFIIYDDWVFIEKYWSENWLEYIGILVLWFLLYFITFSIYYWTIAIILILTYYKFIFKNKKEL